MSKKGSDCMVKDKISYLKSIRNALKTYNEEHDVIDFKLVKKIYDLTNNLDNITKEDKQKLDDFISENTISIKHLANIYLDEKGKTSLNHMIARIIPLQVTKPQCNIKVIKGKEEVLTDAMTKDDKVKVLCKARKVSMVA